MSDLNLFDQSEFKEKEGKWFIFSDDPEFRGFQIRLKLLNPKELNKLRKRCTKARRGRDDFDEDKFFRISTAEVFTCFKGLTYGMLRRLIPDLERVTTTNGKELDDKEDVKFNPDNAFFLRLNSNDIFNFINDRILETEEFYEQRKEEEVKN